ncbi:MAG: dTDP-4-dehydrorhamnose reductase [Anaerolineae bacterium]|nr:dTDP-4-dehydrorhamnose reductase [Anaerolineae bacterium]
MRIAVTGSEGQLGKAIQALVPEDNLLPMDLPEHDITDLAHTVESIRTFAPDVVIHTAAITDVDGCERDPDLAYRVNVIGTRNVAVAACQAGCPVAYISTDYVFDGAKTSPYREYDAPHPLSVYAETKEAGERVVRNHAPAHYIVRVAWLYGAGPRNFPQTVLRLARERREMTMVTDEIGSPTYAHDVAQALLQLVAMPAYGTYHLTNGGVCSRYELAQAIIELAGIEGVMIHPSENYQRLARVPKRCELKNTMAAQLGIRMRPWQDALAAYIESL